MLSAPEKGETEENEEEPGSASVKSTRTSSNMMKWTLWLLANYEYVECAVTKANDIFKHMEDEKDRVSGVSLQPHMLGKFVSHLFGEKVRHMRRGQRTDIYKCYVNLKRRQRQINRDLNGRAVFPLPKRWAKIQDHSCHVSYIRHEGWELNKQRGTTELSVLENANHELTLEVKCHGRTLNVKTDLEFASVLDQYPILEQVWIVIQFIEKTPLCMGFKFSSDEEVSTMLPHVSGVFKNLTSREEEDAVKRAFSLDCLVFAAPERSCPKCRVLLKADKRRKRRRDKRGNSIDRRCNDRYLTKKEMHKKYKQLSKERKATEEVAEGSDSSDE